MRMSQLFGKTLRQDPSGAESISRHLLLKAGLVQQIASGVYAYLPLAWRTLRKIEEIIREEMDAIGAQELMMPLLQPRELWDESGRWKSFGEELFKLRDQRNREYCLGPAYEAVITDLVRRHVQSYRDLPLILYQIQTKLRDEFPPLRRGGGLRVREFDMMDAYSFDVDEAGLEVSYRKVMQAYRNIYRRCGLSVMDTEADSWTIGGQEAREFMLLADTGETKLLHCQHCGYAANQECARFRKSAVADEEPLPIEEVATPRIKTIAALAEFLGIPTSKTHKAVFYKVTYTDRYEIVFAVIRGDFEINEVKLRNALGCTAVEFASDETVAAAGFVAGSASPIGLSGIRVVADDSVTLGANFVAGGNKPDVHLRNVNYPRDFQADVLTDIALAQHGYPCPRCGEPLVERRGIEVGHVFKLGKTYSTKMGALFLDKDGVAKSIVMGCYGIGTGRVAAVAIEQNHDEKGIIWPLPIAPYHIYLIALGRDDPAVVDAAEKLYADLVAQGREVLYDDRDETAGVKFNDADLLGLPIRLTISTRTLKQKGVELKLRQEREATIVPLERLSEEIDQRLAMPVD
jgi:prolyl-tRNA synthetase